MSSNNKKLPKSMKKTLNSLKTEASLSKRLQTQTRKFMGLQSNKTVISAGVKYSLGSTNNVGPMIMHMPLREEALGSVSTSVAFSNATYVLNPANSRTFPWLAPIAARFERYRFRRLYFRFVSTSADAVGSTNTALGSYLMVPNYDVLDAAFTTLQAMQDYGGVDECKPSVSSICEVDCTGKKGGWKASSGEKLVLVSSSATPTYPTYSSAHDYDLGRLEFATEGAQAASVAGRLYVGYELDLIKPKLETVSGLSNRYAKIYEYPANTASATDFLGTSGGALSTFTNMPIVTTATTFTIPLSGRYLVTSKFGTAITAVVLYSVGSNMSIQTSWSQDASTVCRAVSGNIAVNSAIILVTASGTGAANTVTLSGGTSLAAGTADIVISEIPNGAPSFLRGRDIQDTPRHPSREDHGFEMM